MAETQETIADIIAEISNYRDPVVRERRLDVRLKAAHRRELAAVGDAAKLREALLSIKELNFEHEEDWYDFYRIIESALSAPPRNCERFQTVKQAKKAYCAEVRRVFVWDGCETERLVDWLLAPAQEKEGGTK